MSREIKFRGYVKDISDFGDDVVPHKGHFVFGNRVQDKGFSYIVGGMSEANDEYALLEYWQPVGNENIDEFTGLKDKNGKDIYEGDIVCVSDAYEDVDYVDAVIWGDKDDYPAFDLKNHAREYDANALSSIFNGEFETIEVIGNIHENPELVEVDK